MTGVSVVVERQVVVLSTELVILSCSTVYSMYSIRKSCAHFDDTRACTNLR